MNPDSALWGTIAVIITGALTWLGVRYTGKSSVEVAATNARSSVEADAYAKALEIWTKTVARLESEVRDLGEEVRKLKDSRAASDQRESRLEERVRVLEQTLIDNDIEVPPWTRPPVVT